MAALVGNKIGVEICDALGIDNQYVQRVILDFGVDDIVRAQVTRIVTEDMGSKIVSKLESYTFKAE